MRELGSLLFDLVGNVLGGGKVVHAGLANNEHRERANSYQGRHDFIGHLPRPEFRQVKSTGAGHQKRQTVAKDIRSSQRRLQPLLGNLDAVGINGHILSGGGKGHQQAAKSHHFRRCRSIHVSHQVQPRGDTRLRKDNPAPPLAQKPVEQRQFQAVHHRCPEHLD